MNILYVSVLCSKSKYEEIFKNGKQKPGQQVQKYHRLMSEGLSKCEDVNLTVLSGLPISREITKKIYFTKHSEYINNISYNYVAFINIPIIRQIGLVLGCFFSTINFCLKNKDVVIICDILNVSVSMGSLLASKCIRKKNVGIVTDIPKFLISKDKNKINFFKRITEIIFIRINNLVLNSINSYVFLTEQMEVLVNRYNKPNVVIEGQVDINMKNISNTINNKYTKKVCIYSGLLKSIYGIETLVNAFIKANIDNSELHIYGNGDYKNRLIEICRENVNIKYFGEVENDIVVKAQLKAILLINPRPSHEEYTKYSFPSKNMEYMASGTPTLTTILPGMPKEYRNYVFSIADETIEGMSKILTEILSRPIEELHSAGSKARDFVLQEKNNIVQSKKIINMIKEMGI